MAEQQDPARWQLLRQLRWPLAAIFAASFALVRLLETSLLNTIRSESRDLIDLVVWSAIGALGIWVCLTWLASRERHHQASLEATLAEQRRLNAELERTNRHLRLLSEVTRRFASSATLDEILDAALSAPAQLVPVEASAIVLLDGGDPTEVRRSGATAETLAVRRHALGLPEIAPSLTEARSLTSPWGECLLLPLYDGLAVIGWIELYLGSVRSTEDERTLLWTIGLEVAEAISGARRRVREAVAVYQLDRAIAEERARIARDIHDGVAQSLAFQRMRVDLWLDWVERDPERLRAELVNLKAMLREQIGEIRRAIFALRPLQFDEVGFLAGLSRYALEFANQHGWQIEIDTADAPAELSPEVEAACFRVVQEALTNVAKHAKARQVTLTLAASYGGLAVTVRDDGCGFAAPPRGGLGLQLMRERLAAIGGRVSVTSQPQQGTVVRAWLPLPARSLVAS
ncbi:MAG: GAF domain-containing sensor histidine kinase [Chloroflexota bacterium]|nr:GAF domain-containing sensor histidine kinase [Dehalococcoidia bacterium]MDW8254999.1 GAF domain-containing sensor histidine kinase [Chloroflexota bacterium]